MPRISIEDIAVSSFFTETPSLDTGEKICTADISTCPRTSPEGGCICTGDFSTCSRTSPQGGCDTRVQCVTG
jgi:hypothetical protein